jgi:hypothetical protein
MLLYVPNNLESLTEKMNVILSTESYEFRIYNSIIHSLESYEFSELTSKTTRFN